MLFTKLSMAILPSISLAASSKRHWFWRGSSSRPHRIAFTLSTILELSVNCKTFTLKYFFPFSTFFWFSKRAQQFETWLPLFYKRNTPSHPVLFSNTYPLRSQASDNIHNMLAPGKGSLLEGTGVSLLIDRTLHCFAWLTASAQPFVFKGLSWLGPCLSSPRFSRNSAALIYAALWHISFGLTLSPVPSAGTLRRTHHMPPMPLSSYQTTQVLWEWQKFEFAYWSVLL